MESSCIVFRPIGTVDFRQVVYGLPATWLAAWR